MAVFAGLLAWAYVAQPEYMRASTGGLVRLSALMVGLPVVGGWVVVEVMERVRPRRVFDARVKRGGTLVLAGLAAGLVSVVAATPLVALVQWLNDAAAMGGGAVIGASLVLLVLG